MNIVNRYAKIVCWCFLILFLSISGIAFHSFAKEAKGQIIEKGEETSENDKAYEVTGPLTITVILERVYLDGEVSEEIKEETIWSMEDFWAQYEGWQLIDQDEEQVVFQQRIEDISPLLKANGYFGITEDGTFSIFNGKPETENVIQSFFQIDVDKLESRQHEELIRGIPVKSKDKYVEVMEVFKPFSITQ
ncbi:BofC C-terminal domain-containing protein [Bacillus salitolerans]|uniref:BofC C-terminal domain-containing protein n=1 Tax=Bacillus salitolerans TaxID=1437434 RepID=A0ABW4LMD5_9BACI